MHLDMAGIGWYRGGILGVEVDGRHLAETSQHLLDSGGENLPDRHLVLKFDFGLGGMDVHIDSLRVNGEAQEIVGLLTLGDKLLVGRHHRLMEIGVTHIALVDKHELQGVALAGVLGLADIALHLDNRGVDAYGQQLLIHAVAHQRDDALAESPLHQLVHHIAVVHEREFHLVVDKGKLFKLLDDVAQLYLIGLEELTAGRNIKENVLDHEVAALGAHVRLLALAL